MNLRRYLLRVLNFGLLQWFGLRVFFTFKKGDEKNPIGVGLKYDVLPLTGWWDKYEPILGPEIGSLGWRWSADDADAG